MGNKTFAIIKPDAVKNGYTGKIYDRILKAGFNILCARLLKMTKAQAEGFYAVHKGRPFYSELTEFMSSNNCMVLALEQSVPPTQKKLLKAQFVKILLIMYKRMLYMVQIVMKMQKKKLPFSSQRVNL